MEYYSAIKKNEIMPFAATWMDLEMIILSEVSQIEKDSPLFLIDLLSSTLTAQWMGADHQDTRGAQGGHAG